MKLRDIFKKKAKTQLPQAEVKKEKKSEKIPEIRPRKIKEKTSGEFYNIIKAPHITEKTTALSENNQYAFKVYPRANKTEIKKAIESLYDVDAISVKIINVPRKERRLGKISGFRKGYKKAIIKIKEGQKIEVMPH